MTLEVVINASDVRGTRSAAAALAYGHLAHQPSVQVKVELTEDQHVAVVEAMERTGGPAIVTIDSLSVVGIHHNFEATDRLDRESVASR